MLPLGTALPTFRLRDLDGRELSSEDFRTAPGLLVAFICPHCPFVKHMRQEFAAFAKQYRDRGKIGDVGISEVSIDEIERARRVVPIAAVQNHYNLSERKHEAVVDYCAREDIVFVPFFPLHGNGGTAVKEIAARHEATPAQIELAWLLRRSPTILPTPGTRSPEHLKENLAALQIELTDTEFEALL